MGSSNSTSKVVLVTGGSGYLAGWLICGLLRDGYTVRTTVRNLFSAESVTAAVASQVDVSDRLTFHAADLLRDDGWPDAVRGCDFVMHVASPMGQGAKRGTDLVGPAREGTLRVLKAAAKAGVRHVVSTSSTAAAMQPIGSIARADESVWTDTAVSGVMEYMRSKTLAERAAWEFMRTSAGAMTLTTILPGLVLGPVLSQSASGSVELVLRMLTGRMPALPRIGFSIVDVRDVVELHLLALRRPAAYGERFIGAGDFLWMSDIARLLREQLGGRAAKVPRRALPDLVLRLAALFQNDARTIAPLIGKRAEFDINKSARLLGWHPRPSTETVLACAHSLIEHGLA